MDTQTWIMIVIGLAIIGSINGITAKIKQLIKVVNFLDTETLGKIHNLLEISDGRLEEIETYQHEMAHLMKKPGKYNHLREE